MRLSGYGPRTTGGLIKFCTVMDDGMLNLIPLLLGLSLPLAYQYGRRSGNFTKVTGILKDKWGIKGRTTFMMSSSNPKV